MFIFGSVLKRRINDTAIWPGQFKDSLSIGGQGANEEGNLGTVLREPRGPEVKNLFYSLVAKER